MKCTGKEWDTCRVEKMGCTGCYYDESKADEMFKKLGYKKQYENENIYYYMDVDLKDNYIVFETEYKSFTKISCYHDAGDITMQELQAINKKCKEMEWLQ